MDKVKTRKAIHKFDVAVDDIRYFPALLAVVVYPPTFFFWILVHPLISFWRRINPAPSYIIIVAILFVAMGM